MQTPRGRRAESQLGAGDRQAAGSSWKCPGQSRARREHLHGHRMGTGAARTPTHSEAAELGSSEHRGLRNVGPLGIGKHRGAGSALPSHVPAPAAATCPGGPGKEAAGVCSGRNRASIDLLLLKPELLSGTLQSGCPCTRFLEGAVPSALTVPPKHLVQSLPWQTGHAAGLQVDESRREPSTQHLWSLSTPAAVPSCANAMMPAGAEGSPITPHLVLVITRAQQHSLPLSSALLKRVYWRGAVIASSLAG